MLWKASWAQRKKCWSQEPISESSGNKILFFWVGMLKGCAVGIRMNWRQSSPPMNCNLKHLDSRNISLEKDNILGLKFLVQRNKWMENTEEKE